MQASHSLLKSPLVMPRGTHLSDFEQGQIVAYHHAGKNYSEIGRLLGRKHETIRRFLKDSGNYGTKKRSGRPKKLSCKAIRRILRASSMENQSASEIRISQQVPLTTRSVQRIISSAPYMKYMKRKQQPKLKPEHKAIRLSWTEARISWTNKWKEVVFSDEKKFNLDGPDGCQYYWHDLRKEPQFFSKRVQGGGSVMVWAAFSFKGKTPIAFLEGRQNAISYQTILQQYLLPHGRRLGGPQWVFQQDNAPIHSASSSIHWFQERKVRVLDWPSRSPDLNPIENLWGTLVRKVYSNGKQYESRGELISAITSAWREISVEELQDLVESMPKRLVEVLKKNGNSIRF